jgi:hypothetical protein
MSYELDFLNKDEYAKELKQYFLDLKSSSKSVMIVATTSSSSLSSLEAISTTQLTTTQLTTTQLTTTHHLTKKITHLSQDEYAKELSFFSLFLQKQPKRVGNSWKSRFFGKIESRKRFGNY